MAFYSRSGSVIDGLSTSARVRGGPRLPVRPAVTTWRDVARGSRRTATDPRPTDVGGDPRQAARTSMMSVAAARTVSWCSSARSYARVQCKHPRPSESSPDAGAGLGMGRLGRARLAPDRSRIFFPHRRLARIAAADEQGVDSAGDFERPNMLALDPPRRAPAWAGSGQAHQVRCSRTKWVSYAQCNSYVGRRAGAGAGVFARGR